MAEAVANPLIAALRANTVLQGAMPSGAKALTFPWQQNTGGALVVRPPKLAAPRPPAQPPPRPNVPPPTPAVPPFNPNFNPRLSPDGRLPYQDMRIEADSPVTDKFSVRQTLEQLLADPAPQVVEQPAVEPMPDLSIPAFDSGINFEMPTELFRTPAPFVPGFTPDAEVYAAMQAPVQLTPAPVPATTPVPEPEYIDPSLLAMLGGEVTQPVAATQPVIEEPIYGNELPWWYMDELNGGWNNR